MTLTSLPQFPQLVMLLVESILPHKYVTRIQLLQAKPIAWLSIQPDTINTQPGSNHHLINEIRPLL